MKYLNAKEYILGLLTIVTGVLFWYTYKATASNFSFLSFQFSWILILLSAFLVSVSIGLLLITEKWYFVTIFALALLPVLFIFGITPSYIVLYILSIGTSFLGFSRTKDEEENRVDSKVWRPLRSGLPIILTSISLILASSYYLTLTADTVLNGSNLIPRGFYNLIINSSSGPRAIQTVFPGFDPNLTTDQYIRMIFERDTGTKFSSLPNSEQTAILAQSRNQIYQQYGVKISGDERLGDVFYKAMVNRSDVLIQPYKQFLPFAFAIALFIFLRTTASPYSWFVILVSWGIIELLLRFKIIQITRIQRVQEELVWKP